MATRIYTDATDFDAQQGHFTIEVVDNQYYLRIGALNSEDQRLIGSLIEDGFVGFFQDDVRIGIAGIASTYDAGNDRIEIDSELPELKIEDAYVIRFTQARPGEDGAGGIGTPGEDGEHAEIEVEDTNTGIRVRGKSGGEPDFGPWQDVRDGIDGQDGIDGEPGQEGEDGEHAEIEVEDTNTGIRVRGKSGGEPDFGPWQDVRDGIDGQDGIDGEPGQEGDDGEHAEIEVEDTNTGIRVRGKSGGEPDFGPWQDVRDGIDGQDGIDGEPGQEGDDGEHAEIEVEDTNTGIRVRGKSGGEPDFGPWQDVRDGIDGEPGQEGEDGEHAEIEIEDTNTGIRVRGKSGGEPDFGPWQDVRDGIDGEPGEDGEDGNDGDDGWSPKFATVSDGERRVLQVADWFGGSGTKPDIGQYIGATGFVAAIADGVDIRGPAGEDGEDGTGICTAHTVLNDSNGTRNLRTVELPANYTDYDNIYFNIFGNNEFRQNSLKISTLVDGRRYRVGGISDIIWNETSRTFTLSDGKAAGNFRHVILTGCEDDGGTPNPTETLQSGTVSLSATRFAYWKPDGIKRTAPAAGNSDINIGSGAIGHWIRHKNKVFFTFAVLFQITTDMEQARVYFQPPAGETIENCIGSAAALGGGEVYGVNVFGADSADADTAQDEIEVSAVTQGTQSSRFPNVIGVSCAYEIVN